MDKKLKRWLRWLDKLKEIGEGARILQFEEIMLILVIHSL
jgi:hypothetical protein